MNKGTQAEWESRLRKFISVMDFDCFRRGLKPPAKEQRPVNWAENQISRIHPALFFRPGIYAWAIVIVFHRGLKPPAKEQRPVNWAENQISRIHPALFFRPGIYAWAYWARTHTI
jgi:hypothetical protein